MGVVMDSIEIEHTELKWTKETEYVCPIHNDIGTSVLRVSLPKAFDRNFCLYCLQDLIMKHCTEVKEKSDDI